MEPKSERPALLPKLQKLQVGCCSEERNEVIGDIGNIKPFRLTKESAFKLMIAVATTNAKVLACCVDHTCPHVHIVMRVDVPDANVQQFMHLCERAIEKPERITGQ